MRRSTRCASRPGSRRLAGARYPRPAVRAFAEEIAAGLAGATASGGCPRRRGVRPAGLRRPCAPAGCGAGRRDGRLRRGQADQAGARDRRDARSRTAGRGRRRGPSRPASRRARARWRSGPVSPPPDRRRGGVRLNATCSSRPAHLPTSRKAGSRRMCAGVSRRFRHPTGAGTARLRGSISPAPSCGGDARRLAGQRGASISAPMPSSSTTPPCSAPASPLRGLRTAAPGRCRRAPRPRLLLPRARARLCGEYPYVPTLRRRPLDFEGAFEPGMVVCVGEATSARRAEAEGVKLEGPVPDHADSAVEAAHETYPFCGRPAGVGAQIAARCGRTIAKSGQPSLTPFAAVLHPF